MYVVVIHLRASHVIVMHVFVMHERERYAMVMNGSVSCVLTRHVMDICLSLKLVTCSRHARVVHVRANHVGQEM
jgi:hypothetical protein